MKKKWENPVVNILGLSETEQFKVWCNGSIDINGGQIRACQHENDPFTIVEANTHEEARNNVYDTDWGKTHLGACSAWQGNNRVWSIDISC